MQRAKTQSPAAMGGNSVRPEGLPCLAHQERKGFVVMFTLRPSLDDVRMSACRGGGVGFGESGCNVGYESYVSNIKLT